MEREELAELFQTYGTDVFRLAFSYLGSQADAEDVCQSVFLKLAEGRQGPRPGKEKRWLLACTANACKSHLRSFWYRSVGELDEAALFQDGEDRAVYAAVKALPPKYRAVVHQGEIGEILHISRTAVQTRMSRARAMLKKELNGDDGEEIPAYDGAGKHG